MSVSPRPIPVIKGDAAKRLIEELKTPADNRELLEKCRKLGSVFVER